MASKIIAGTSNFNEPLILSSREDALININNRFNTIGNLRVRDIEAKLNKKSNSKQKDLLKENEKPLTLENLPSLSIAIATEVSPIEIRNRI